MFFVKLIMLQACWLTCSSAALCWGPWPCASSLTFWQIYAHATIPNRKCPCRAQRADGNSAFGGRRQIWLGGRARPGRGETPLPASFAARTLLIRPAGGRPQVLLISMSCMQSLKHAR